MSRPQVKEASQLEVRLAVPGDETAIAEVLSEAFGQLRHDYTDESFAIVTPPAEVIAKRFDEGPMWVATLAGHVVGTLSATTEDAGFYIRSVAVRPASQGLGVGHKLMDTLDEYLSNTDVERVFLYTTYFTPGAQQIYEKHGFRWVRDTTADEWFGTPGLEMEKILKRDKKINVVGS